MPTDSTVLNSPLSHSLTCKWAVNSEHILYDIGYISRVWKLAHGLKFWRSVHCSAKPTLEWWTTDTTSPTPVSWVSETRCHYTSPGQDVHRGDQGREGETHVCERVDGSPSPGSGMHATAYFRGNKDKRNVLTDMLVSICGVPWPFDIRISICETDISFIGYRLTSLIWMLFCFIKWNWCLSWLECTNHHTPSHMACCCYIAIERSSMVNHVEKVLFFCACVYCVCSAV